jgi:hypothetical protein
MNSQIEKIRQLLSELESGSHAGTPALDRGFSALELPLVIQEIVDDLQPQLTPYDAAFYWFLFRHSIAAGGNPILRVSTSHLRTAVVKSSYSQADESPVSFGKVQDTLRALEGIGAIRKEGEATRDGTLYRVMIPDQIESCRRLRAERLASEQGLRFPPSETDHITVRENRLRVFERDGYCCRDCRKQVTRFTAALARVVPESEGGGNSLENLVTVCLDCFARRDQQEQVEITEGV